MNNKGNSFTHGKGLAISISTLWFGIYFKNIYIIIIGVILYIPLILNMKETIHLNRKRRYVLKQYRKYVVCDNTYNYSPFKGFRNENIVESILFEFHSKRYLLIYENGYGYGCFKYDIDKINPIIVDNTASNIVDVGWKEHEDNMINFDELQAEMDYDIQINAICEGIISSISNKVEPSTIEQLYKDLKKCLTKMPTIKIDLINDISFSIVEQSDGTIEDNEALKITSRIVEKYFLSFIKCAVPYSRYCYGNEIMLFEKYIFSIPEVESKLPFELNCHLSVYADVDIRYVMDKHYELYQFFLSFWTESKETISLSDDVKKDIDDRIAVVEGKRIVYEQQQQLLNEELRLKSPH